MTRRTADQLTDEEKKAIEDRKIKSTEKYLVTKEKVEKASVKRKLIKAMVHEGNHFLDSLGDSANVFYIDLAGGFIITTAVVAGSEQNGFTKCEIAYSLKMPTDTSNDRIGRGLCGYRLKHGSSICECIPTLYIYPKSDTLRELITCIVMQKFLLQGADIPQRFINFVNAPLKKNLKNKLKELEIRKTIESALKACDFKTVYKNACIYRDMMQKDSEEYKEISKIISVADALVEQ